MLLGAGASDSGFPDLPPLPSSAFCPVYTTLSTDSPNLQQAPSPTCWVSKALSCLRGTWIQQVSQLLSEKGIIP